MTLMACRPVITTYGKVAAEEQKQPAGFPKASQLFRKAGTPIPQSNKTLQKRECLEASLLQRTVVAANTQSCCHPKTGVLKNRLWKGNTATCLKMNYMTVTANTCIQNTQHT